MAEITGINYAKYLGIHSLAGAIVFAVLYAPFFLWFAWQSIGRPTYVFIILSLFCIIRVAAFSVRASLAASEAAGENISILIADQVLFGAGFFGVMYSAYTLVLDRFQLTDAEPSNPLLRLSRNRRIFRVALIAAVVIGVVGATEISATNPESGKTLRTVSSAVFLVLTVLLALQTVLLSRAEAKNGYRTPGTRSIGGEHGSYILGVIAVLLIVREAFSTAAISNGVIFYNEHFWYPLYALPELLAVMLYATPGLIPSRAELPQPQ
ncbi:hypothetical protein H0H92_009270 [Tricholoma furcatifolium]|nr:hypothetical protein H0H92_009270 [Tricholoma furcatifolium]